MGCFDWPARRWFRILWVLVAIGLLASLPVLIIQASKHGWSVQDQVRHRPVGCQYAGLQQMTHMVSFWGAALAKQTAGRACRLLPAAALHRCHSSVAACAVCVVPA